MTREEYLLQLGKYLKHLPKEDYASAIEYFEEYFSESGDENVSAVIQELGSPKEAATELLKNLINSKCISENANPKKLIKHKRLLMLFLFLAAPVEMPLLLLIMIAGFFMLAILSVLFLGLFTYTLATFGSGIRYVYQGFAMITLSVPAASVLSGAGMLEIGISLFIGCLEFLLCRQLINLMTILLQKQCQKHIINDQL